MSPVLDAVAAKSGTGPPGVLPRTGAALSDLALTLRAQVSWPNHRSDGAKAAKAARPLP
jgi:hypothetical protein